VENEEDQAEKYIEKMMSLKQEKNKRKNSA
jgi:hypothetical protein